MLWIKAFHIIFMVTWFAGLFYLPRLYVYHAEAKDTLSLTRFKIMEARLYYFITTPGMLLTVAFGSWLIWLYPQLYLHMLWMHLKLGLAALLILYHLYLGVLLHAFRHDSNRHSPVFYRWLNEIPSLFLIMIVMLAVVKPS